ncbi:transcriptional regulator [Thermobifida fusca YX]|uniref:Transcriptional regulator n=1 Tax=Thermobifida fusca (strain YX) TaxID=269800 RepID=Q47L46_THEFY|nr:MULTISPECIES: helix-turn-helix domain-containing protein [Thermobifida]AAZ56826.1 transcriptional regulator [Thermobifida fusca YX]MBO2529886.1 transcriptional regulator [Thermobifida sp.]MDD6791483.1 helix-turn-helix domain-containing protein [Thermobifida fusca]PPS92429.1 transcriptional regulator [Thermobifida fusca]PZN66335.1 MAG: transcriptional regulator [Thermobifida fusca]
MRTPGIDPGEHRVFADPSRVAVWEALRRAPGPLTVQDLAQRVGLHANTVRGHLAILAERGYVTSAPEERDQPGRPRLLYSAVTDETAALRNYRLLAEMLVDYLAETAADHAAAAIDAGRSYGRRMVHAPQAGERVDADTAIRAVATLLDQAGFRPRRSAAGIDLHRCPFRELAESAPDIVCGIHLGMMRGVLAELGAPVEAVRLRPFAEPDRCVAELRPRKETE